MAWNNVHKWCIKYNDIPNPDLDELFSQIEVYGLNTCTITGTTPLHFACLGKYIHIPQFLFELGADINYSNYDGQTPLHFACKNGCLPIVEYLINCGADVISCDIDNNTPLHYAVESGNINIVKLLLNHRIAKETMKYENNNGQNPLLLALDYNEDDIFQLLLET